MLFLFRWLLPGAARFFSFLFAIANLARRLMKRQNEKSSGGA